MALYLFVITIFFKYLIQNASKKKSYLFNPTTPPRSSVTIVKIIYALRVQDIFSNKKWGLKLFFLYIMLKIMNVAYTNIKKCIIYFRIYYLFLEYFNQAL